MNFFKKTASYIQNLNKKDFDKYLALFISGLILLIIFIIYYIHTTSNNLIYKINFNKKLSLKTEKIINNYQRLKSEENKLLKLLEKNKDFNIKTYFEQFCSQYQIIPESNWETTTRSFPGNEKFDEISLTATFKNQTTKDLVNLLEAFDKKEIIYVKELSITSEQDKTITINITIATKKYKRG